MKKAIQVLC